MIKYWKILKKIIEINKKIYYNSIKTEDFKQIRDIKL